MAFVLNCEVVIGKLEINFAKSIQMDSANSIEIEDTWMKMTNTAVLKIAKRIAVKGEKDFSSKPISEVIKTGDKVTISLGYNGSLKEEFRGYVARSPKPTIPLEIECEDEMWQLKRMSVVSKTIKKCKVSDLVNYIAPGYEYDLLDSELGTFAIGLSGPETAAQVLFRLEKESGLKSFFRIGKRGNPVLVVHKPLLWSISEQAPVIDEVTLDIERNLPKDGQNIRYVLGSDKRIKVNAKSIQPDNKQLKAKFIGDEDGETRSLHYYNISQTQLEQNAKDDYNILKQDGLEGELTSFGQPYTESGQVARIIWELQGIDDRYFINRVKKTFDTGGFRRVNTIGFKAQ